MKNSILMLLLVIFIISCSSLKNETQGTYDIINIVLSEEINKKKDSINLFAGGGFIGTEWEKMLNRKESKTYRSFKGFLNHYKIPIELEIEKAYFNEQMLEPFNLEAEKIKATKLNFYEFGNNEIVKEKYSDLRFRKNYFYLVKPIFTKNHKYAILYQRVNDHIFYFRIFKNQNNTWKQVRIYNSSNVIIDGVEVELF